MSIHPSSSFPVLVRDQAEVIQIFLQLMRDGDLAGRGSKVTTSQPIGPRDDPNGSLFSNEPPDLA